MDNKIPNKRVILLCWRDISIIILILVLVPWVLINDWPVKLSSCDTAKMFICIKSHLMYEHAFFAWVKIVSLLKIKHVLSNPFKN